MRCVKGHGAGCHVCGVNINDLLSERIACSSEIRSPLTSSAALRSQKKQYKYLTWCNWYHWLSACERALSSCLRFIISVELILFLRVMNGWER